MLPIASILIGLGQNLALLLALLFLYRLVSALGPAIHPQLSSFVLGGLFGGIAILGMSLPIQVAPGIMIDGRVVIVALAGLFGGPVSAAAAGILVALYQLWLGGGGALAGAGTVLSGAALGALLHWRWGRRGRHFSPGTLVIFGLILAIVSLLWTFTLTAAVAWPTLRTLALPMLIFYPLGTLFLGTLFAQEIRRHDAETALRASEERYARLADAAFEGITLCEHEIVVDTNACLAAMLGYTREELVGMPAEQLVAPEARDLLRKRTQAGYQGRYELLALQKDGGILPVEIQARDARYRGRPIRVTAIRDISERLAVQHALMASELRFRVAFQANPTPQILTQAADGTFLDVNPAYERLTGWSRDELLGKRTTDFPLWVDLKRAALMADMAATGRLRDRPTRARDKAGALHDLILSIEPVQVGETPCLLCVMIDITERLAAEQALARSERMFKELVQSVTAVVWEADARTFVFSFVSEQAEKLLGYPTADWLATPTFWADHIHPDDRDGAIEYCLSCTRALEHHEFEYRMIAADGRVVWLRDFVTVVAEDGQPIRLRGVMVDITAQKHAEDARRASEERYRQIVETAEEGIWTLDLANTTVFVNPKLARWLGYTVEEMLGRPIFAFMDADQQAIVAAQLARRRQGISDQYETRFCRKDGSALWALVSASPIMDAQGQYAGGLAMLTDITERKRIEQQYLQAQKMEAIGRLAGGIAHDFNNLLTIILGSSELVLDELGPSHPLRHDVTAIQESGQRAAALTRQLLAFSRKQVLQPEPVNLNLVVARVEQLLRRLIGEDIALISRPAEELGTVQADPTQLEQVLLNLAVNARDAMPRGGTLIIETADVVLDASYTHERDEVISGPYVLLAVSDTGSGMDRETQARIFEPFFTTKEVGKGTGLGLATVYGIVQQSGGYIWVYSEVGHGTTFRIYLPRVGAPTWPHAPAAGLEPPAHDTGTILLVEDEPLVRELASRVLRARGYHVLEAGDGVSALRIAGEHTVGIDVLLTDVVMPGGVSGPQVAEQLIVRHPGLAVLYMSGYTDTALAQHAEFEQRSALLQKPFVPAGLLRAVWQVRRMQEQEIAGLC